MERITIVRMSWLAGAAAAVALGACTGSGRPEADLPDSAMLQVPADPAAAPQPIQADSVTRAPARTPSGSVAPAQPATTTPPRPPLRQPPEARDIRPSIPYPPDTL
ncbi:MAG TPA: hypothetical protein VM033_02460 [Gemmatimonadaceae bacterium]|nr:hypothetical protein [Gemmatimonadaceae bacterium]